MARPARARTVGGVEERRRAFCVVSVASSRERRERCVVKRAWGESWGLWFSRMAGMVEMGSVDVDV